MKTLEIQVPDRLAAEIARLVEAGWFLDESELARQALLDFLRRFRPDLEERFQRDDIAWALGLSKARA